MKRYGIIIIEMTEEPNGKALKHIFKPRHREEEIFRYIVPADEIDIKNILRAIIWEPKTIGPKKEG